MEARKLHWRLARNCSLTPRQTLISWAVPIGVSLLVAIAFWAMGYGVVALFCMVEVLAVGVALWVYARHAVDGDTVELGDDGVMHIERRCGAQDAVITWNAADVRMEVDARGRWVVWRGPHRLTIGTETTAKRRRQAAQEVSDALQIATRSPTAPGQRAGRG